MARAALPVAVPAAAARGLVLAGLAVGLLLLALPVRTSIAGDPLLRLRQLDPELAPLRVDVSCGLPLGALDTRARSTGFHEVARADACRDAARRRAAVAAAVAGLLVVAGLLGRHGVAPRPEPSPAPARGPWAEAAGA